jgi:hypothetical protein
MGFPTSEVGYTSATTGRENHEVNKGHVVVLGERERGGGERKEGRKKENKEIKKGKGKKLPDKVPISNLNNARLKHIQWNLGLQATWSASVLQDEQKF